MSYRCATLLILKKSFPGTSTPAPRIEEQRPISLNHAVDSLDSQSDNNQPDESLPSAFFGPQPKRARVQTVIHNVNHIFPLFNHLYFSVSFLPVGVIYDTHHISNKASEIDVDI